MTSWWRRRDRFTKGLAAWVPISLLWIALVPLPGAWPIPLVFWLGYCAGWGEGVKDAQQRIEQTRRAVRMRVTDELRERREKARWN
jgi:hypothetical protein